MSDEAGSSSAGESYEDLSEYRGPSRLYMSLAKLVEYNNCILSRMDAEAIEKGIHGESLDDLREAINGVSIGVVRLWRPLLNDMAKWERQGTPEEASVLGVVRRYVAGMIGLLKEGEEDPRPGLTEEQRDRVLKFLLWQGPAIPEHGTTPNPRASASRSWRSFWRSLRTFLTPRKVRH